MQTTHGLTTTPRNPEKFIRLYDTTVSGDLHMFVGGGLLDVIRRGGGLSSRMRSFSNLACRLLDQDPPPLDSMEVEKWDRSTFWGNLPRPFWKQMSGEGLFTKTCSEPYSRNDFTFYMMFLARFKKHKPRYSYYYH